MNHVQLPPRAPWTNAPQSDNGQERPHHDAREPSFSGHINPFPSDLYHQNAPGNPIGLHHQHDAGPPKDRAPNRDYGIENAVQAAQSPQTGDASSHHTVTPDERENMGFPFAVHVPGDVAGPPHHAGPDPGGAQPMSDDVHAAYPPHGVLAVTPVQMPEAHVPPLAQAEPGDPQFGGAIPIAVEKNQQNQGPLPSTKNAAPAQYRIKKSNDRKRRLWDGAQPLTPNAIYLLYYILCFSLESVACGMPWHVLRASHLGACSNFTNAAGDNAWEFQRSLLWDEHAQAVSAPLPSIETGSPGSSNAGFQVQHTLTQLDFHHMFSIATLWATEQNNSSANGHCARFF